MDGNSSERGRHRHRAHPTGPGDPQWIPPSDDRPQWTPPAERPSWFDAPVTPGRASGADRPAAEDPEATAAWSTPLVPGPGDRAPRPVAGGGRDDRDPAAAPAWSPMAGGFRPAVGRGDDEPAVGSWSLAAAPCAWGAPT